MTWLAFVSEPVQERASGRESLAESEAQRERERVGDADLLSPPPSSVLESTGMKNNDSIQFLGFKVDVNRKVLCSAVGWGSGGFCKYGRKEKMVVDVEGFMFCGSDDGVIKSETHKQSFSIHEYPSHFFITNLSVCLF